MHVFGIGVRGASKGRSSETFPLPIELNLRLHRPSLRSIGWIPRWNARDEIWDLRLRNIASVIWSRGSPAMQRNNGESCGCPVSVAWVWRQLGWGAVRNILFLWPNERYDMSAFGFGVLRQKLRYMRYFRSMSKTQMGSSIYCYLQLLNSSVSSSSHNISSKLPFPPIS
jgi:hypothetical protein